MIARSLMLPLVALCAVPAIAQQSSIQQSGARPPEPAATAATPSVESYLCTFAGKCDGVDTATVSRNAPRTRGFRLARPSSENAGVEAAGVKRAVARPSVVRKARSNGPYGAGIYGAAPRRYTGNGAATGAPTAALAGTTAVPTTTAAGRPRADLMIGFDLNSAQLSAEGVAAAQVFARSLLTPELRSKRFLIEGHTDLRGGRSVNVALSQARAQAVADYLVMLGVRRSRLQTRGFGPDVPLPGHRATDPTNRRVEAELIS